MSLKQLHKKWRKQFNEDCLKRDNNKCVFCDKTKKLDVHHIINRKEIENGGYSLYNGITLCEEHHYLAELYYQSEITDEEYSHENLFKLINSSKEKAIINSKKLK